MINIINKKCVELIPYENNPRVNGKAVEAVAKSIKEFGMKNPIIIDKNNVIIAGHTRLQALQKLGIELAPCIVADDLTEDQVKAFRIADNSTAQIAEWDLEKLMTEIEGIDLDLSGFGLESQLDDITKIVEEARQIKEDDYDFEKEVKVKVNKGDVWRLGRHRLICGDSTKPEDIGALMDGALADMIMTDPPYNVDYSGKRKLRMKIENDNMEDGEFLQFLSDAFRNASNALKAGGAFYVWLASKEFVNFISALKQNNLIVKEHLVWVKNSFVIGRQDYHWRHEPCLYGWKDGAGHYFIKDRKQSTIFDDSTDIDALSYDELKNTLKRIMDLSDVVYENKPTANKLHPTMKPIKLISRLIRNSSRENEIVLDLFAGSGSTLLACEQTNRISYNVEYDEKYASVIIDRWETFTGGKAEKITQG